MKDFSGDAISMVKGIITKGERATETERKRVGRKEQKE